MTAHPTTTAATFAALVDALIPGDDVFPAASAAGTHGLVLDRARAQLGSDAVSGVVSLLGENFAALDPEARRTAIEALARDQADLFIFLRMATYFAYYEAPPVIAALQSLGHEYHDAPQPKGYTLLPFDRTTDLPAAPGGSYKRTEEISRLDLSSLAALNLPVAEATR